jgi:hypothetical protein
MNKETLRMQMLAGLITESQYKQKLNEENEETYYAMCNVGENSQVSFDDKNPIPLKITIKTDSKEDMIEKLNALYQETVGDAASGYTMNDLDDSHYTSSYVSDDWAIVTKDVNLFNEYLDWAQDDVMSYDEYNQIKGNANWSKLSA